LVLKAPITGRIASMLARPGDVVAPGDVLYRIAGGGGLWVQVRTPVGLAGQLQVGATATIETDARPGEVFAATVLDPGLEADPGTGTVEVTLALDDPAAGLIPGMAVTASIVSGGEREALTVPDAAVVDSSGESLVFVKTGPESFEARPVRTGARSADLREIVSGLEPAERVVVQGTYTLRSLAGR
jgi:RND family efflux transporter MFP subunit